MNNLESRLFHYNPDAGGIGSEYGSIVAPYIGAAFEGSRILKKVRDIRTGLAEVPVYKVEDSDERQLWAFRNIHAYSEYTSPLTVHWKIAADDWVLDIRTATSSGKLDPADPDRKKRIPLDRTERQGTVESEKLMKAMIAVTASARAMDTSAGSMDKYVEALVGGDADRADTWSEFLIHGVSGKEKIKMLMSNPAIKHYYDKLVSDTQTGLNCQLAGYLEKKTDYKGGFREYSYSFLLDETEQEVEVLSSTYNLIQDSEVRTAAAKLATDIFLVDKYTEWEFEFEKSYNDAHASETDPEKRRIQLKPTENWGGNPLRAVIEPSFLPKVIKNMYREDPQIFKWVDEAFTFDFKIPDNLPREQRIRLETLKDNFEKNNQLKPTMTTPLKALNRYGQALMIFFAGSTAQGLPAFNKNSFMPGEKAVINIWELMNQVIGDTSGLPKDEREKEEFERRFGKEKIPFGKQVMGWFTERVLFIKAAAAVRQFSPPGTFELMFSQNDIRNLREVAEILFGSKLRSEAGVVKETNSDRLGFKYGAKNMIPGVIDDLEQTKNTLLLGGEKGKEEAFIQRFLQATFGIAVAITTGGGKKR